MHCTLTCDIIHNVVITALDVTGGLVAGELMSHCTWYSTPLMCIAISVRIIQLLALHLARQNLARTLTL